MNSLTSIAAVVCEEQQWLLEEPVLSPATHVRLVVLLTDKCSVTTDVSASGARDPSNSFTNLQLSHFTHSVPDACTGIVVTMHVNFNARIFKEVIVCSINSK